MRFKTRRFFAIIFTILIFMQASFAAPAFSLRVYAAENEGVENNVIAVENELEKKTVKQEPVQELKETDQESVSEEKGTDQESVSEEKETNQESVPEEKETDQESVLEEKETDQESVPEEKETDQEAASEVIENEPDSTLVAVISRGNNNSTGDSADFSEESEKANDENPFSEDGKVIKNANDLINADQKSDSTAEDPVSEADYHVFYFAQNADNNNYSFLGSVEKKAAVGTEVSVTEDEAKNDIAVFENKVQDLSHFFFSSVESGTVTTDNSTVISVYYDRISYTLKWNGDVYNPIEEKWENIGVSNTTITARYGASITNEWIETFNKRFPDYAWGITENNNDKVVSYDTMPGGETTEIIVYAFLPSKGAADKDQYLEYWLENYEGKELTDNEHIEGSKFGLLKQVVAHFNYLFKNSDYYEIDGYQRAETDSYSGYDASYIDDNNKSRNYILGNETPIQDLVVKFFYFAKEYPLELYDYNGEKISSDWIKYNTDITDYLEEHIPDAPAENAEWMGWFTDFAFVNQFNPEEETMPTGLVLHAGWKLKEETGENTSNSEEPENTVTEEPAVTEEPIAAEEPAVTEDPPLTEDTEEKDSETPAASEEPDDTAETEKTEEEKKETVPAVTDVGGGNNTGTTGNSGTAADTGASQGQNRTGGAAANTSRAAADSSSNGSLQTETSAVTAEVPAAAAPEEEAPVEIAEITEEDIPQAAPVHTGTPEFVEKAAKAVAKTAEAAGKAILEAARDAREAITTIIENRGPLAVMNLFFAAASFILCFGSLLTYFDRSKAIREEDTYDPDWEVPAADPAETKSQILKLFGLLPAGISIVLFTLTENLLYGTTLFFDKWTVVMLGLFVTNAVLSILAGREKA